MIAHLLMFQGINEMRYFLLFLWISIPIFTLPMDSHKKRSLSTPKTPPAKRSKRSSQRLALSQREKINILEQENHELEKKLNELNTKKNQLQAKNVFLKTEIKKYRAALTTLMNFLYKENKILIEENHQLIIKNRYFYMYDTSSSYRLNNY